jgi:hypothetical protein
MRSVRMRSACASCVSPSAGFAASMGFAGSTGSTAFASSFAGWPETFGASFVLSKAAFTVSATEIGCSTAAAAEGSDVGRSTILAGCHLAAVMLSRRLKARSSSGPCRYAVDDGFLRPWRRLQGLGLGRFVAHLDAAVLLQVRAMRDRLEISEPSIIER